MASSFRIKRTVLAVSLALATICTNGFAATFIVNKTADTNDGVCDSHCSLREAIVAANKDSTADIININPGTYVLTRQGAGEEIAALGDLDIKYSVTINGGGRANTIINGNGTDRVFHVMSGATVNINKLKIMNGLVTNFARGAGLLNEGTTNLASVHFDGNVAAGYGGAIESRGPNYTAAVLSVSSGLFTNNCSDSGGAMDTVGKLTVVNSIFNGNKPIVKGSVDCKNGDGAAIHVQLGDNATINRSTFINNIGHVGAVTGINGKTTITNSTFTNNKGIGGTYSMGAGAIENQYSSAVIVVKNSTITNNTSSNSGGGTYGVITLQNSIIANNTASSGGADCAGSPISNGNNLFGTINQCGVIKKTSDAEGNTKLGVATLDATTGHTYIPLLAGSPAIDKLDITGCPTNDQLGKLRPVDGDGNGIAICDIGAYEKP